jgi:hypothetical protein
VFAFVLLPRGRCFLRRFFAVLSGAAGARMLSEFLPVFSDISTPVMLRRFLDIGEGQFAIFVRDADRLVKAGPVCRLAFTASRRLLGEGQIPEAVSR